MDGWQTIRYQQRGPAPSTLDGPFTIAQHLADALAVLAGLGAGHVPWLEQSGYVAAALAQVRKRAGIG